MSARRLAPKRTRPRPRGKRRASPSGRGRGADRLARPRRPCRRAVGEVGAATGVAHDPEVAQVVPEVIQPPWLMPLDEGERLVQSCECVGGGDVGAGVLDHHLETADELVLRGSGRCTLAPAPVRADTVYEGTVRGGCRRGRSATRRWCPTGSGRQHVAHAVRRRSTAVADRPPSPSTRGPSTHSRPAHEPTARLAARCGRDPRWRFHRSHGAVA